MCDSSYSHCVLPHPKIFKKEEKQYISKILGGANPTINLHPNYFQVMIIISCNG
jgi:hypothetical protein